MTLVRGVFEKISEGAVKQLNVSTRQQCLDSTLVVSNIRVRSRLDLFSSTITVCSATIRGRWNTSEHGIHWCEFPNNGPALDKHLYLRFFGETNMSPPYQVYWQVVKTGTDAVSKGCHRGQIAPSESVGQSGLRSTTMVSKPSRNERTLYRGMHWVEFFVVRDGVCLARSGPFVVNIM